MDTQHPHLHHIVRRANNPELVILTLPDCKADWRLQNHQDRPSWCEESVYFLVHPNHVDTALAYLEGAVVECLKPHKATWYEVRSPSFAPSTKYRIKKQPERVTVHVGIIKKADKDRASTLTFVGATPSMTQAARDLYNWTTVKGEIQL
jgi:hypothetical protein